MQVPCEFVASSRLSLYEMSKLLLLMGVLKINHLSISSASHILEKQVRELIFEDPPYIQIRSLVACAKFQICTV